MSRSIKKRGHLAVAHIKALSGNSKYRGASCAESIEKLSMQNASEQIQYPLILNAIGERVQRIKRIEAIAKSELEDFDLAGIPLKKPNRSKSKSRKNKTTGADYTISISPHMNKQIKNDCLRDSAKHFCTPALNATDLERGLKKFLIDTFELNIEISKNDKIKNDDRVKVTVDYFKSIASKTHIRDFYPIMKNAHKNIFYEHRYNSLVT